MYFDNVKINDEIYSIIYGTGKVIYVLEKKLRTDGFYTFQVQFEDEKVYYTEDGVPEWCSADGCRQTVYYKEDIDMLALDYQTIKKDLLSKKKIVKLKESGELEMRVPSGAWRNVRDCPNRVYLQALQDQEFYLFRKK